MTGRRGRETASEDGRGCGLAFGIEAFGIGAFGIGALGIGALGIEALSIALFFPSCVCVRLSSAELFLSSSC